MDTRDITERIDRSTARWGPDTLRIVVALLWLSNVSWKVPTEFGDSGGSCRGLCGYVQDGIDHPVLPGSAWLFDAIVQPNLVAFGWTTLVVEGALAALLLSGRFVRTAAVIGILQSLGIMAAVANTPGEWYWSYLLMAGLSLAILVSAPAMRPTDAKVMAAVTAAYGVAVAITHAGAGFTGDSNSSWTLFGGARPFLDDFGRNVFPGSIALGVGLVVVALAAWVLAGSGDGVRRVTGWGLVALSAVLLLTYGPDGLILRLGSKATTVAVLAALGLSLVPRNRDQERPGRDLTAVASS